MRALPCSRCRTPLPADARFCGGCGQTAPTRTQALSIDGPGPSFLATQVGGPIADPNADRLALGFARPGEGTPICLGCGVVAPRQQAAGKPCEVCQLDSPPQHERVAIPHAPRQRTMWVGVRCEFQCRACGHLSPLNHLDVDGSVQCLRCGIEQIFAVDTWRNGLAHAHAVADLAGPDGNAWRDFGALPPSHPFHNVGVTTAVASAHDQTVAIRGDGLVEIRSLRVTASPGHPLCGRCRIPLTTTSVTPQELTVTCRHCSDTQRYHLPAPVHNLCPGLRGVVADEHRVGGREIEYDPQSAVVAIRCPNCQAPVSVSGKSTIIDCDYCHVALRIPDPLLHRLGHDAPSPLLWWLLLEGPSLLRAKLQADGPNGPEYADPKKPRPSKHRRPKHTRKPVRRPKAADTQRAFGGKLGWLVPLMITCAVGYFGFGERINAWQMPAAIGSESHQRSQGNQFAEPSTNPPDNDDWPGSRELFTHIRQCECRGKLGRKRVSVKLAGRIREYGSPEEPDIALAYYLDVGQNAYQLEVDGDTAPPIRIGERVLGLGIGCHEDRALVVAGQRISAWSLTDGHRLWTTRLEEPYRHTGKARDRGLNVRCDRLQVKRGRVRVPLGRSRHLRFDVATGQARR